METPYWLDEPTSGRRLVLGGRRDATLDADFTADEATTEPVQDSLEALLRDLVGFAPAITHRWAGIFGTSPDDRPLVGPVPGRERVWVSRGYSGHGNVLGLACGESVAKAILGRHEPELDLFDPARLL